MTFDFMNGELSGASSFLRKTLLCSLLGLTLSTSVYSQANDDGQQAGETAKRRPRFFFDERCPDVHDPVMAYEGGKYYVFSTGVGISVMSSTDMKVWKRENAVFRTPPKWAVDMIDGYRGHTWAPDIYYSNGLWYLYYSCSTFGKNTSAIGLAINKTLNPDSPDFKWEDRGMVLNSSPERTNWNAIDPNLIVDGKGRPWLTFGSFWDGIQLVKLDSGMGKLDKRAKYKTVSRRVHLKSSHASSEEAGVNAVEAPFIIKNGKYYYLFVSFDYCCKGMNSTYKVAVGRSKKVTGPYVDKDGKCMEEGGGTVLLGPNDEYAGIGHCSVYEFGGKWYIVAHAYSKKHNGASKLFIRGLSFDAEGWPKVE